MPVAVAVTVVMPDAGVSVEGEKTTVVPSLSVAPSEWKVTRSFDQR